MTRNDALPGGEHFQSAIAHWQLDLQTELKKASSLPTAMFDASDPMLEARLAESTESLFRCLLDQPAPDQKPVPADRRRLEAVPPAELSALLAAAAADGFAVDALPALDEHRDEEFLAVLGETCLRAPETQRQLACALLRQLSGVAGDDLESFAAAIARQLVLNPDPAGVDARALAAVCHRIAVAVQANLPPGGPGWTTA